MVFRFGNYLSIELWGKMFILHITAALVLFLFKDTYSRTEERIYGGTSLFYATFLPFFTITFCQFRWTKATFYLLWNFLMQTVGASHLSDSIIFGISCSDSSQHYISRTKMLDKSHPTLTSPEKKWNHHF